MLKAYLEITLRRNGDVSQYFVLQKIFHYLHLGFVETKGTEGVVPIGLSFPEYHNKGLGNKLRLLSTEENVLAKFNAKERLARFKDYLHLTAIRPVPSRRINGYARYQRQQPKSLAHYRRLVRRMSERDGISIEDATARITDFEQRELKTPYINVCSAGSGRRFRLFIAKKIAKVSAYRGFSSYGLSDRSTVPEF